MQRYKLEIVVAGETHSSKSELAKQIINAAIEGGETVALVDWEQGGLQSKDTLASINRNITDANKKHLHVSADVPRTKEALKALADNFTVVVIDSASKVKGEYSNAWLDELREECPGTIWIPLLQLTADGKARGGTHAEFDAPVVIKTFRGGDYTQNYAELTKSRGNTVGLIYNIAHKQIVEE